MKEVKPKVYLIGSTQLDVKGLKQFLIDTSNEEFLDILTGNDLIDLISFYAKLCYKSLTLGKNKNVTKIRDINENFIGIINSCHGSVCEHAMINFVAENVSRIETTEHIRHRAGTAYSQESGRYCWDSNLKIWYPEIAEKYPLLKRNIKAVTKFAEKKMNETYNNLVPLCKNFNEKKILTSAIRRMKPMGCGETLGFSINIRALRHVIELRTSRHAEEEIRIVFGQVAEIMKEKIPLLFIDCSETFIDNHKEFKFENTKI
jgi:thymidylate synthase (FAD)